ncbi:MAG: transcriptional regulator [Alphaproteobacteria bacterium]|nr:MAG: transcriptional regulator [Alphaproteobacteria bacterium]
MKRKLPTLQSLITFEAVGRNGNLYRAASELSVTHSAVSYQLRHLEEQLEIPLLGRKGRQISITPQGQRLLATLTESLDRIHGVIGELQEPISERSIKIATTPAIASSPIMEYAREFIEQFRLVEFTWVPITQIDETVDLVISWRDVHMPGEKEVTHIQTTYFPVCSPNLLHLGAPLSRIDHISEHTLIHGNYDGSDWNHLLRGIGRGEIRAKANMYLGDTFVAHQAARAGCGIAIADEILVDRDLREGQLIRVLSVSVPAPAPLCTITPHRSRNNLLVQAFKRWFMSKVGDLPSQVAKNENPSPPDE